MRLSFRKLADRLDNWWDIFGDEIIGLTICGFAGFGFLMFIALMVTGPRMNRFVNEVNRIEADGHTYVQLRNLCGFTHDPDCPCHTNLVEAAR